MAAGAGLLVLAGVATGGIVMYSGIYNVAASSEHTALMYWILEQGMRSSVRTHAAGIRAPNLDDPELLRRGAHCYHIKCAQCHGAPGVAPDDIGKGLLPIPNSLTQTALDLPPEQIYWITRHGIRMAGMPAWEYRLADRDLWAIAAFVKRQLPRLTVQQYRELIEAVTNETCQRPSGTQKPSAARGLIAIRQYGCHGCHKIPGVTGPNIFVGPPLEGFARRSIIAGVLPHTRENLILWLRDPQTVNPRTQMPDLDVTEQHAADMAAYLESLE